MMDKILIVSPSPLFYEGIKVALFTGRSHHDTGFTATKYIDNAQKIIKNNLSIRLLIIDCLSLTYSSIHILEEVIKTKGIPLLVISDQPFLRTLQELNGVLCFEHTLDKTASIKQIREKVHNILNGKANGFSSSFLGHANQSNEVAPTSLTEREHDVLSLLLEGKSNHQISEHLNIQICTVKAHVSSLLVKHSVTNRTELTYRLTLEASEIKPDGISSQTAPHNNLTKREVEIIELITTGSPNKVISYELNIQETTVKKHVSNILRKMNVSNRTQLTRLVIEAKDENQNFRNCSKR